MMRSLFSGVSGLKTHQTKMDVIGNNISNVNTVAFKSSSTTFSDIMYQTTSQASGPSDTRGGTNAKQIGLGVTNGATKISITSSGAAQSTGDALDIRLTDTNTTNFFIVNNGSQNLFTRAGSFYIDGAGNLAMTTTGYFVMGWQVDPETMTIRKDTVSPLRVMSAENKTSKPEATTLATFSGIIDKNDTNVKSSSGYVRSLTFYDSEGYTYTAKFSIKVQDPITGKYSVELTNVYDSNNKDILADYVSNGGNVNNIFGKDDVDNKTYNLASGFSYSKFATVAKPDPDNDGDYKGYLTYKDGGDTYVYEIPKDDVLKTDTTKATKFAFYKVTGSNPLVYDTATAANKKEFTLDQVFGITAKELENADDDLTTTINTATSTDDFKLSVKYPTVNYGIQFDTSDGTFKTLTTDGFTTEVGNTVTFNADLLGPNRQETVEENAALSKIQIDFSQLLNYDNGGTSTVVSEKGGLNPAIGAGKKPGTMTGLSISGNGMIYGSYDNGNTVLLGQIAVAKFPNASGLEELGDNCYNTTLNSGDFDGIGVDISEDGSSMSTGQLEMSNVDLSAEFTDMIVTQRGFQANSRIITVSDTLLEELINLKR